MNKLKDLIVSLPSSKIESGYDKMIAEVNNNKNKLIKDYDKIIAETNDKKEKLSEEFNRIEQECINEYNEAMNYYVNVFDNCIKENGEKLNNGTQLTNKFLCNNTKINKYAKADFIYELHKYGYIVDFNIVYEHDGLEYDNYFKYNIIKI